MKASLWEKKWWLFYGYKSDNIESYAAYNTLLRPRICDIHCRPVIKYDSPEQKVLNTKHEMHFFLSCVTFLFHIFACAATLSAFFFFLFRKKKFICHIISLKPHIFRSLGSIHFGFLLSKKKSYLNILRE